MQLLLSVIVCAHNPHTGRLGRTLAALRAQTLPPERWETLLVDNASAPTIDAAAFADSAPPNLRVVREPALGLSAARRRGLGEAGAPLVVFADDDNVLAPDYLATVVRLFDEHPRLGALGGKCQPEFEAAPASWTREFFPLLALRDLGAQRLSSHHQAGARLEYPAFAPIGAGMALRVAATASWRVEPAHSRLADRTGRELSSAGDNDLVFSILRAGWEVAYDPALSLTHLIPAARLAPDYLARLNRGIQKSWMQVLTKHAANPWPPIAPWTVPLRQLKAWFTHRAWSGPAARIRWQGACGHFEGRAAA